MQDEKRHSSVGAFFWSFLEQGGTKAMGLIVQIILARLLSPSAFGVLAILLVVINLVDIVAQSGMGTALIQSKNADDTSFTTAFWLSEALAMAMYLLVFVAAPAISAYYAMPDLTRYLRVMSLVLLTNAANSIQRSYLQKTFDFKGLFRANTIAAFASGIVGIALAAFGAGVWALVAQTLSLSVFACLVLIHVVPWRPSFTFRKSEAGELFSFGWRMCVSGIINTLYTSVSELILGKAVPSSELGFYSQGRKYPTSVITMLTNALANVLFPTFSELADDKERLKAAVKRGLRLGTFIVAPSSVLFAVIARPAIALLLTEKWLPCVPIFQMICISYVLLIPDIVNLRVYMALGRSDLYLNIQIEKVVLGIVGIGGTAFVTHDVYATAAGTMIFNYFAILFIETRPSKRLLDYGLLDQMKDLAPTLVASALAAVAAVPVGLAPMPNFLLLLVQALAYIAAFMACAHLLEPAALKEVKGMVIKVLKREDPSASKSK